MTVDLKSRDYAQRLLAYEATANGPCAAKDAASRVTKKLRRALVTLAGARGVHALLSRSLTLAKRETPILTLLRVRPDGSIEGLNEVSELHSDAEVGEAVVILIAQWLGLLSAFIGESLTVHLLREAWPDLPFDDTNSPGTK